MHIYYLLRRFNSQVGIVGLSIVMGACSAAPAVSPTQVIVPASSPPSVATVEATSAASADRPAVAEAATSIAEDLQSLGVPAEHQKTPPGSERFAGSKETAATTLYTHPDGWWSLRYPADMLHVEDLGDGVTIFISQARSTFAAVDSYLADGNAYGNTGENLRNRARDTLQRIYSTPPIETDILGTPDAPWETGIEFATARGSQGIALYQQPRRNQSDYRVYGFIYGYKVANEATALPMLQTVKESFTLNDQ